MKSTKTIAVFAMVLVALSILIVSALGVGTSNNRASDKSSILSKNILPMPQIKTGNFIMWTSDGKNLIWGTYSLRIINPCNNSNYCPTNSEPYYSGTFKGKDNIGNKLKGSFLRNTFSGYFIDNSGDYVGKTFFGSYENGRWKAQGLFGQKESAGEYKFFPMNIIIQV